ncbi:hypothetical protein SEUCBS139899_002497 [Sporothrix eucalyptigena]|uniref:rRNA adenine N(6)-methyltransferase n=1 Tax=Sporothrix eucalyptigena TaxID=1812306 RepID=A0ABP0B3Z7_9PEZI
MLAARGPPRPIFGTVPRASTRRSPTASTTASSTCTSRPPLCRIPRQCRSKTFISQDMTRESSSLAEQLGATGLWHYGGTKKKIDDSTTKTKTKTKKVKGDKHRVNIVSEPLCDDILGYMGKSLADRHAGCDLLDIYPGAGLWSRKLHDLLQPRQHILLEPDKQLYQPFLQPLLDRPNVSLVPKSGIIWRDLSQVLDTMLPYQTERPRGIDHTPVRNDTLLVTANIAFFPKRRFNIFDSVAQLVLYQFINSIRASSLFHRYGLVRMLLWVEASDRHPLLARSCQRRKRLAIDGELATEWITEIAGPDDFSQWYIRADNLDRASCRQTLLRMKEAGIVIPEGREPKSVRTELVPAAPAAPPLAPPKPKKRGRKPKNPPPEPEPEPADFLAMPSMFQRPYMVELSELKAKAAAGKIGPNGPKEADYKHMLKLQYRFNQETRLNAGIHELLQARDRLAADKAAVLERSDSDRSGDSKDGERSEDTKIKDKLTTREAKWNADVDSLTVNSRKQFLLSRDNLHLFQQDPPVLAWDRRALEPLVAQDSEFFPNAPCALLDIQPKAMHPLLRTGRPDQSGDMFELILRGMIAMGAEPVSKAIESVWPGAADGVLPHCPSLTDPLKGGYTVGGAYGEMTVRTLNETQWTEILDAWMQWPFRPTLPQLVARITEEAEANPDDDVMM